MHKWIILMTALIVGFTVMPAAATESHDMKGHAGDSHGAAGSDSHTKMAAYEHKAVVDGVRAEFQVMSLAKMNMTDPDGKTHHIMVKFFMDAMDHRIDNAVGSIKVIAPDEQAQTSALKNYGGGILAANFSFAAKGKYGVICLFKVDGQKHVVKFWYPHHG